MYPSPTLMSPKSSSNVVDISVLPIKSSSVTPSIPVMSPLSYLSNKTLLTPVATLLNSSLVV